MMQASSLQSQRVKHFPGITYVSELADIIPWNLVNIKPFFQNYCSLWISHNPYWRHRQLLSLGCFRPYSYILIRSNNKCQGQTLPSSAAKSVTKNKTFNDIDTCFFLRRSWLFLSLVSYFVIRSFKKSALQTSWMLKSVSSVLWK